MANFKTHMVVGASVAGVSSTLLLSTQNLSASEALLMFTLGTVGSLFPDLDSDNSTPFKVTFTLLSVLLAFFVIFSKDNYSLIEMAILWFGTFYFMKLVVEELFKKFTVHRGIFHSLPMAFFFGILGYFSLKALFWIEPHTAIWGGFFVFLGFLTHLVLDEVYSVDLTNNRLKRSFGTAINLYEKNNIIGTIILYALIGFLGYQIDGYYIVTDVIFSTQFYGDIFGNILPQNGWFNDLLKI
jgi:membrane-bound metal-dependent hydrolase YbcI (DUF457 family)